MNPRCAPTRLLALMLASVLAGAIGCDDGDDGAGTPPPDDASTDANAPDPMIPDAAAPDAAAPDAAVPDAMAPDAMNPDAMAPDAMAPDASDHDGGDHEDMPPAPVVPSSADGLTRDYVRLEFDDGRPPQALDPRAIVIVDGDGTPLDVVRVLPVSGTSAVVVETAAQVATTYTVGPDGPSFFGTATPGPALLSAVSEGPERVRLTFTEPVGPSRAVAAFATFVGLDGHPLVERAQIFPEFDQVVVTTSGQVNGARYRVRVFGTPLSTVELMPLDTTADTAEFTGIAAPDDGTPFRVVSAAAPDPTSVRVQFNRSVAEATVRPENFVITQESVNAEAGALAVLVAEVADVRGNTVRLTTRGQNEITYRLTVAGVTDVAGLPIGPREVGPGGVIDPGSITFAGARAPDALDSDGDGLSDAVEQRGWLVIVSRGGDDLEARQMTSDPRSADTDGDGLGDAVERRLGSDPRSADTDFDQIDDAEEFDVWFSDTNDQDTDADGLSDTAEIRLYGTAALDPDTDGDQLSDADEILLLGANPRRADLPELDFEIGAFDLTLDAVTEFTSTEGVSMSRSRALDMTIAASRENSAELSRGGSATNSLEVEAGVEVSLSSLGVSTSATVASETSRSINFTEASRTAAERSTRTAFEVDDGIDFDQSVTRRVEGAAMLATLTLRNAGEVAFTVRDMELSALRVPPGQPGAALPVAVLSNDAEIALGTLGAAAEAGPLIFRTEPDGIFPSQVMALLADARGLTVELSRFDITYRGRPDGPELSLAEVTEEVTRRTATLTIDFGDGRVETHQIAVARQYGPDGRPMGITLAEALEDVLDLPTGDVLRAFFPHEVVAVAQGDDVQVVPPGTPVEDGDIIIAAGPNGVLDTLPVGEIRGGGTGFETATVDQVVPGGTIRVRRISRVLDVADSVVQDRRFWTFITDADPGGVTDVDLVRLEAGQQYLLAFVADQDGDTVLDREEFQNGASDTLFNSDGCPGDDPLTAALEGGCPPGAADTLDDRIEMRVGWLVEVAGEPARRVFSDPADGDSDDDGLPDHQERACGLDPHAADTDGDGLTDGEELNGIAGREDEVRNIPLPPLCSPGNRAFSDPRNRDTDADGFGDGVEARLRRSPIVANPPDDRRIVTVRYTQVTIDDDCDPGRLGAFEDDDLARGAGDFLIQLRASPLGTPRRFLVFSADVAESGGLEAEDALVRIPPGTNIALDGAFTWRLDDDQRIELAGTMIELDDEDGLGNPPERDAVLEFGPLDGPGASFLVGDLAPRTPLLFVGEGLCGPDDDRPYRFTVSAFIEVE